MTKSFNFQSQPLWFRALNSMWRSSYLVGTKIRLERDDLIRRARKATGLHDLGHDFWEEPLDRMLVSMNEEANLNPLGRFISRERLVSLLSIRLRATEYFKRFPEILEQELYPAWIIVGLQRTGTTKLQRLLATDPDHRVLPSWEAINPVPLTILPVHQLPNDKRIRIARNSVRALKRISPSFFAIHPIDALQPEEDVLLLDISFMSTTTEAMMDVTSYASWLESIDQTPAYVYYVKLLKLLQWFRPAKRWVLKSPHHLEFPHIIDQQIPKVTFIWPHRTIYESIPSFLSMLTYNHMIFSDDVDPQKIATRWTGKTGYVLEKSIEFRKQGNNDTKFIDIDYRDLVTDSLNEMKKIYRQEGGLNPELADLFVSHEKEHPHQKHGIHRYNLSDFGMTKADIDHHTSHYQQFFSTTYDRIP
ncbi:MAG: sulfotransferase [Bacteroidetes bacterium]|nr:sulfotransferase [Bacteroidota bacterium]